MDHHDIKYLSKRRIIIRVFEYQELRLGDVLGDVVFSEDHWRTLAHYHEYVNSKYYSLIYQGIRFSHYVGVIQLGTLTIEILPKADRATEGDHQLWHGVLLDMLRSCRLISIETLSSAHLRMRPNSILEWYFEVFLEQVEALLRRGLLRAYQRKAENSTTWRGRLLFRQQLIHNLNRKERVYVEHEQYTFDHLLNRIVKQALLVLQAFPLTPILADRCRRLLQQMPAVQQGQITAADFKRLPYNRKAQSYQPVLDTARMIILNYSPDIRGGKHQLLAILFDMNLLFEEYIYQQLQRMETVELRVQRQQRRSFWMRRSIRPDLILTYRGKKIVLDTKWKVLREAKPSMPDLKQLYIYCRYFNAAQAALLYPKVYPIADLAPTPFQREEAQDALYTCQVCFLEVVKAGRLNRDLGSEILEKILIS